jgi:hypothetical protein
MASSCGFFVENWGRECLLKGAQGTSGFRIRVPANVRYRGVKQPSRAILSTPPSLLVRALLVGNLSRQWVG